MKFLFLMVMALGIISGSAFADFSESDDSDLSGPRTFSDIGESPSASLTADSVESTPGTEPLTLEILREDHGKLLGVAELLVGGHPTDQSGRVILPACTGASRKLQITLQNKYISIGNSSEIYYLAFEAACTGTLKLKFHSDSVGGQALGIWQVAIRAKNKLEASIGLGFWKNTLPFVWPADGDYYSWHEVHITRGDYWDVVGHEMGHGIYDMGNLGIFGGGPHKIDQCYSNAMAISEGWATFFSGWVNLDLAEAKAHFEYLVPRRAPINIETIPSDVCQGQTNEWRVAGFFWDIVDSHDDGETLEEPFSRVWGAMKNTRSASTKEAMDHLKTAGIDSKQLDLVWALNFQN